MLESMYNQQLSRSSAQLSGGQLLLGDTWKQLHPNCYTQLFRLRHFYQRFWLHHHKNKLRQIEQKHTWTHAENHSVHLHTQRDTSTAEAVFTKQQTERSMFLAMLEKSNSAPNHEDLCFLYKTTSLQQIPLLTDSNYLPWMGEMFRKLFPSNQSVPFNSQGTEPISKGTRKHWLVCRYHILLSLLLMAKKCKAGI